MNLNVREIQEQDIKWLANYWLDATPNFLRSMGADPKRLPDRMAFTERLLQQLSLPIEEKKSYALIWEIDGKALGHSNANAIEFGQQAKMHLHLWQSIHRRQNIGTKLVQLSLPFYFERLKLKTLICEPYALNPAPNKTLRKVGFKFIKKYRTTPGSITFEQEVNRWELTNAEYQALRKP